MTKLCSVCHGSGSDPTSLLKTPLKPLCPHCLGSGDEPGYDEEDLDEETLWESINDSQNDIDEQEDYDEEDLED